MRGLSPPTESPPLLVPAPPEEIKDVHRCTSPFLADHRPTRSQRRGLLYEASVSAALRGLGFDTGVWFSFRTSKRPGIIQVDALRLGPPIDLVEIKLRHCPEAFEQLRRYEPVIRAWRPGPLRLIEICGSFDPAAGPASRVERLADAVAGPLNVLVWRPKEEEDWQ